MAVVTMWLWLLTPLELIYSGMPLALSWSVLVGWSVIRLVTRFAAGLVMSALETIQPGSFQPLEMANVGDSSVLASAGRFSATTTKPFVGPPPAGFGASARSPPRPGRGVVATRVAGRPTSPAGWGGLLGTGGAHA